MGGQDRYYSYGSSELEDVVFLRICGVCEKIIVFPELQEKRHVG